MAQDELREQFEREVAELIAEGFSPEDAREAVCVVRHGGDIIRDMPGRRESDKTAEESKKAAD